jgi:hypothetical protein
MNIISSNLLADALSLIGRSVLLYYKENGRTLNDVGEYVATYDLPINVEGSFQPIPRNLYESYGLDFQKSYFNFYVLKNIIDVSRGTSGDKLVFEGDEYQVQSRTEWYPFDEWEAVLCVKIDNA